MQSEAKEKEEKVTEGESGGGGGEEGASSRSEGWGGGQDCISSLCSGRLNQQCQVFFLEAVWCSSR